MSISSLGKAHERSRDFLFCSSPYAPYFYSLLGVRVERGRTTEGVGLFGTIRDFTRVASLIFTNIRNGVIRGQKDFFAEPSRFATGPGNRICKAQVHEAFNPSTDGRCCLCFECRGGPVSF